MYNVSLTVLPYKMKMGIGYWRLLRGSIPTQKRTMYKMTIYNMADHYANNIPALPPLASGVDDSSAPAIVQGEALASKHVTAAALQYQNRKLFAECVPALATEDEVVASQRRKHIVQSSNFDGPVPAWAQQFIASQRGMQETQREMHWEMKEMQREMKEMQREIQQEMKETQRVMKEVQREIQQEMKETQRVMKEVQLEIQQEMKEMQQAIQREMKETQRETQQEMQQISRRLDLESERNMNRSRRLTDPIVSVVRLSDGMKPNVHPHNLWFPANQEELFAVAGPRLNDLLDFYGLGKGEDVMAKNRLMAHLGVNTV